MSYFRTGMEKISEIVFLAIFLRIAIIAVTHYLFDFYLSQWLQWYYTDIDYFIYTDAAYHLQLGDSPYERITYRYPPFLAQMMNPTLFSAFGKCLFSIADGLAIYEISMILQNIARRSEKVEKKRPETTSVLTWTWIWALNPVTIYLSTRGSCDSLSSYGVLVILRLLSSFSLQTFIAPSTLLLTGTITGFVCWFRLYPVLYLPMITCFVHLKTKNLHQSLFFAQTVAVTGFALVLFHYNYYGDAYLRESLLYHLIRRDHRHNFSSFFYPIYLEKSLQLISSASPPPRWIQHLEKLLSLTVWLVFGLISLLFGRLMQKYPSSSFQWLSRGLFLLTVVFVSFNKVITAQYFLWFIVFLPLLQTSWEAVFTVVGWNGLLLVLWLIMAARLELRGENSFLSTWIASILFLIGNVWSIHRGIFSLRAICSDEESK